MHAPPTAVVAVIALLGGAAAGLGLERAGVLSPLAEPEAAVVRADRVAVLDCPEGSVLTALGRGDRVLATGRSADDEWVEIRSPLDLDARAWLPIGVVSGDEGEGDLADLPVRECEERDGPTTSTSSTTTSSTTSTSTSTTLLEETTIPEPPPEETTVPPPPTPPPDTTPPTLASPTVGPNPVYDENDASEADCPSIVNLSVTAVDNVGVTQVTFTWQVTQGGSGSGFLTQQGNTWTGSFIVPKTGIPPGGQPQRPLNVTFRAVDAAGNQAAPLAGPTITILDSTECPIG